MIRNLRQYWNADLEIENNSKDLRRGTILKALDALGPKAKLSVEFQQDEQIVAPKDIMSGLIRLMKEVFGACPDHPIPANLDQSARIID